LDDIWRHAPLLTRQADVQNPDLVAQRVAMNAERVRGAPEVSRGALHGADNVLLLEFLLRQIEGNAVGQELVDNLLQLPVQIHVTSPPLKQNRWNAADLSRAMSVRVAMQVTATRATSTKAES